MLFLYFLLISSLTGINCQSSSYYCGSTTNYYGTYGTINAFVYSTGYMNGANCTYNWHVPSLSAVSLTILSLGTERCRTLCTCDWVELSCRSHSVNLPTRYCGTGSNLNPITFTPCKQIVIRFKSDSSVTGTGYTISYRADPIECLGNCTPVSNSYGYVCPCDTNQTNITMPTMHPNPQCMGGCILNSDYNSMTYCVCAVSGSTYTTRTTCPSGCSISYDFYGYSSCSCSGSTTTSRPCSSGCYRSTDYLGYPYCNCPSSSSRPLSCPYGCYSDSDYWGNQYCNCPISTQPPIWCSSGCVSDINVNGDRYCRCPTTTLPPCFSPCYYSWDYTYDYSGRMICYCPPTTTNPPPSGCNQTLTATFGTVTSPNYPNAYTRGIDCYQYIAVPMATSIKIRVLDMNVYYSSSYSCEYDYIEITGCDGSITQFCTSYTLPSNGLVFQCTDNSVVIVRFHSYSYYYYSSYRGFKLSYSAGFASNCSDSGYYLSQGSTGVIGSPNYPNNFPGYSECFNYLFTDDDNIQIRITFDQLRLEDSDTCRNVFIKLTCQDGSENAQIVCGTRIPVPMTFECRTLQIWFRSNSTTSFNPRNYKLRYYAVTQNPSTTVPSASVAAEPQSAETDLPQSSKLGIGLGVGVGGFFLIILIVIIIFLIVCGQRQTARIEQHRMADLAVICKSINPGGGSDPAGSVRNLSEPSGGSAEGFTNPMATDSMEKIWKK